VENIWHGAGTECKYNVMIQAAQPLEAQEGPISGTNGDVAEGRFEVQFEHEGARACSYEIVDSMFNHVIFNSGLIVRDLIID
ncbi:hypothetical protein C0993_009496, partial [Termitomyces sp. T159_Od127]